MLTRLAIYRAVALQPPLGRKGPLVTLYVRLLHIYTNSYGQLWPAGWLARLLGRRVGPRSLAPVATLASHWNGFEYLMSMEQIEDGPVGATMTMMMTKRSSSRMTNGMGARSWPLGGPKVAPAGGRETLKLVCPRGARGL